VKKGAKEIIVANRTLETAQQLAKIIGGRAIAFADFVETMKDVDIVVSSTGCPVTIIHKPEVEKIMAQRPDRPLFFIDIAVPRDIHPDVAQIPGVHLFDIDALEATVRENVTHRQHDLDQCDAIIEEKIEELQPHLTRIFGTCEPVRVSQEAELVLA
jgi:glutamyl-tRNA reductase